MESIIKSSEKLSPILNELLGKARTEATSTIDLSLDTASAPIPLTVEASSSQIVEAKKLYLGVEDTKTKWASLRRSLKPASGDWIQAKDDTLENFVTPSDSKAQSSSSILNLEHNNQLDNAEEVVTLLHESTSALKGELDFIKEELSNIKLFKNAIQSLGGKLGDNHTGLVSGLDGLGQKFDYNTLAIGQKLEGLGKRLDTLKEDLPEINHSANEVVLTALGEFEDKWLRLGAAQSDLLSLKENLGDIQANLNNLNEQKNLIESLGNQLGESSGHLSSLGERFDDTAWIFGQKLDGIEGKFESFRGDLPALHQNANETIVNAIREFEDKFLRLGAAQLDSISRIKGIEGGYQIEEIQESINYLVAGQKNILDSISDVLKTVKTIALSVSNLPGHKFLEELSERQEDQVDSLKLEIVESRQEDREENNFMKLALMSLASICLLTFGAIVYTIIA